MKKQDILLIWDFDDTIVHTNVEFEKTNREAGLILQKSIGQEVDIEEILTFQRSRDVELIKPYGFIPERYHESWRQTYEHFAKKKGKPVLTSVIETIRATVEDVYERVYKNIPYVPYVLHSLHQAGYPMVILTAGVDHIQRKKIKEAGVESYFQNIYVYPYKDPSTLREVINRHPAKQYVMIGNSLKSDIYPALENDIWAFHIERETWEADDYPIEKENPKYVHLISAVQIPRKLENIMQIQQ